MDFSKRKITQLIQLLDNQQIEKFLNFLQSPYFIKKEKIPELLNTFRVLVKHITQEQTFHIPEIAFSQVFIVNSVFSLMKMEKTLSQLNSHLLTFLGLEGIQDTNLPAIHTASFLRMKNALNLWQSHIKKLDKSISRNSEETYSNLHEHLAVAIEKFRSKELNHKELSSESFIPLIEAYNQFYLSNVLKIAIHVLSHNKFTYPVELISQFNALEILVNAEEKKELSYENKLLIPIFRLLTDKDPDNIVQLTKIKDFISEYDSKISDGTKTNARTIIKNYAIKMYNLGNLDLGKFIFEMYKQGIEKGWAFYDEKIQIISVINIAHCAINEQEFDWLENFITQVKNKILEQHLREFSFALIYSKLFFAKKEFPKVLEYLDFNATDPSFKGMARILELKTLYELQSLQLEHKLEAFKIYMHRIKKAKVTPWFQKGHNNFIGILRSINHPKTDFDLKRIEKIKKKILETEILAEKKWLIEKIDEKAANVKK